MQSKLSAFIFLSGNQSHHSPLASFRFVMKPDFSDKDFLANPDLIVKWEQVSQMVTCFAC